MKFREADVKALMCSVAWIRACCARLLRLDAMLHSQDPTTFVTHLRAFFVVGWDGVNSDACFNTFIHTSEFLEQFMPCANLPLQHPRLLKALAHDICANVYSVWIDACAAAFVRFALRFAGPKAASSLFPCHRGKPLTPRILSLRAWKRSMPNTCLCPLITIHLMALY